MAELHVLTGSVGDGGGVTKTLVFRYTIPSPNAIAAQDPALVSFESAVPDITQTELDDIRAGNVVERRVPFTYHNTEDLSTLIAQAYALKDSLQAEVEADYAKRYEFYLATPARPA